MEVTILFIQCVKHTHTHTHAALFRPQNNKLMLLNSKDLADL